MARWFDKTEPSLKLARGRPERIPVFGSFGSFSNVKAVRNRQGSAKPDVLLATPCSLILILFQIFTKKKGIERK